MSPMSFGTLESRRCKARSSQTGEPCKRWALRGATVCTSHGAKAPQVAFKAEERIQALVPLALARIEALIDQADMDSIRLAAAKDIMDRAGHKPTEKRQLSGPDGGPIQTEDVGISDDDRAARILAVLERARGRLSGPADGQESDLGSAEGSAD